MASSKIRKFKHNFAADAPLNSAPTMSPAIQTSLLQVGMRVRKSIGQGYRTSWQLEEEKFRLERARNYRISNYPILWEDEPTQAEQDVVPGSQESTHSIESNSSISKSLIPLPTRKRSYNKDEDKEQELVGEQMEAISTCLRPIAQATTRRRLSIRRNMSRESVKKAEMIADYDDAAFLDPANQRNDISDHFRVDAQF